MKNIFVVVVVFLSVQSVVKCQDIDPNDLVSLEQVYPVLKSISPSVRTVISKDPWRQVGGQTNFVFDKAWVEFQGEVIEERDEFLIFNGKFGAIGQVTPEVLGTVRKTDVSSTSSSDSKNKFNSQYNSGLSGNYNSQTRNRQLTNNVNRYKQNSQFNGTENDQYNANDNTTVQQQRNMSETVIQKSLKNFGEDLFVVANFPFPLDVKRDFQELVAKRCGYQTYTNKVGRKVTLPKLDYGTPCEKFFTQSELDRIKEEREAPLRDAAKRAAEAEEQRKREEADKLNNDIKLASEGNTIGLMRMADRYRIGDGVGKDLKKSDDYSNQAHQIMEAEAKRSGEEARVKQQEASRQKFERNLYLADTQKNADSALYVEKCYRFGLGTEIDIKKADEYHAKAVSLGISSQPNRW